MARPNSAPRVDAAERDARALELRAAGASYRQIAERLDVSVSTAWTCVERGLTRTRREPADHLRTLEAERLDRLQVEAVKILQGQHVVIQGGRVVTDKQGRPYVDHGPTLAAIRTLLAVQERRARLFGLDAAIRVDARVLTVDEIDARISELEAQLDAADVAEGRDPYTRKRRQADQIVQDLAGRAGVDYHERARVHDRVLAFWQLWKDDQKALRDVPGFVAAALDTAITILALPPAQAEELAGEVELLLRERAR